jgi:ribosomal protein S14
VINYASDRKSPAWIQRHTGFSWDFVTRWYGPANADDVKRRGRKPLVNSKTRATIKRKMEGKERGSTRSVARDVGLGRETVRKTARRMGLKPYHKPRQPLLTDAHRARRLAFARTFAKQDWRSVVFTDEKIFPLFTKSNSKNDVVWAKSTAEVPPAQRVAKSVGVMVWGGISWRGKLELIRLEGKVDAARYKSILVAGCENANRLFGGDDWLWQQDGAPTHTAAANQQHLLENGINFITKSEWPPNSPDINVIENLWAIISNNIAPRHAKTKDELWRFIQEEWKAIPLETVRSLIDSASKRLAIVRRERGGWTGY